MSDETMKTIEEKIDKGEQLSPEDEKELMSVPNDTPGDIIEAPDDDDDAGAFDNIEDLDGGKGEEGETTGEVKGKDTVTSTIEESKAKIEIEIAKPEGEENLEGLSDSEIEMFWEAKRAVSAQRLLEEENELLKGIPPIVPLPEKIVESKPVETPSDTLTEFLKGKDPEDFVTVEELTQLIPKLNQPRQQPVSNVPTAGDFYQKNYLAMCDKEAANTVGIKEDYAEVMGCVDEIIVNGRFAKLYVNKMGQAVSSGKNPAIAMYNLVKGDPAFPEVIKRVRARFAAETNKGQSKINPQTIKEKEALIEKNKEKLKTSAHHKSTINTTESNDLTARQIADMPMDEYQAMPKKTREYYHKKYAV